MLQCATMGWEIWKSLLTSKADGASSILEAGWQKHYDERPARYLLLSSMVIIEVLLRRLVRKGTSILRSSALASPRSMAQT